MSEQAAGSDPAKAVDVAEAVRRRRMHRTFTDRLVPREVLEQMMWAASRAQQGRSGVRHLVLVDDPAVMATARQVLPGFVNNAPAMIVLCTDVDRSREVGGSAGVTEISRFDAGAACAHLALYAQTLGLGVCTVTSWTVPVVQELLGLPGHIRPDVTVAVGYVPAKPPSSLRGFRTSFHLNRFGATMEVS